MLAGRWVGIEPYHAKSLTLSTASLSVLGYEHNLQQPVIQLWNDTNHLLFSNEQAIYANGLELTEVTR
jgi:hypothetical protein